MITGYFDEGGHPRIRGNIYIPRLAIGGRVWFLLDTGADITSVGASDASDLRIPRRRLGVPTTIGGIGGRGYFSAERAIVAFENEADDSRFSVYEIELHIAHSETGSLPSLLGRNIINRWRIDYDPTNSTLECTVRSADSVT